MKPKTFKTKSIIKDSTKCACYYCLQEFNFNEIIEFIDNKETPVCPNCGIDSVLGDNQVDNLELEKVKMHIHSFCWGYTANKKMIWHPTPLWRNRLKYLYPNLDQFRY